MHRMDRMFLFFLAGAALLIFSCKKETPPPPGPSPAASLTFQGTVHNNLTASYVSGGSNYVHGGSEKNGISFSVTYTSKPSKDTTINIATSTETDISITEGNYTWSASTGSLKVSFGQGYITSSFSNTGFVRLDDNTITATASGSVSTPNK